MILGGPRFPWIIVGSFVSPLVLSVPGFLWMAIKGPSCLLRFIVVLGSIEHFWVTLGALMALLAWVFLKVLMAVVGSKGLVWV